MNILEEKRKSFLSVSNPAVWLAALILASCAALFAIGLSAPVSIGDEVHHYRFAKNCFDLNGRALFDGIYGSPQAPGFFYDTEAAWPLVLSWLWKLAGRVSFPLAQLYQTAYFALLLAGTFRVARKIYGAAEALLAASLVATAPMITSFGILFYLDMPAAALSIWIFCLLLESRYGAAGLLMGAAYLTKKSTGFFVPVAFLWIAVRHWRNIPGLLLNGAKTFAPAGVFVLADERWRRTHLFAQQAITSVEWVIERITAVLGDGTPDARPVIENAFENTRRAVLMVDYANSSIFNPVDAVKYFGLPLLAGLAAYVLTRRWEKKDRSLWAFTLFFLFCTGMLHLFPDIRYLMPIVPFVAILAARGLLPALTRRWAVALLAAACALQFLAASAYTRQQRVLTREIREGFNYLRDETPKDSLILYPETSLLEYAERRMLWTRMNLRMLFWGTEPERQEQILALKLDYIAIKKSRTYEDSRLTELHVGKYPLTFVRLLGRLPYAEIVFENREMAIYKIHRPVPGAPLAAK